MADSLFSNNTSLFGAPSPAAAPTVPPLHPQRHRRSEHLVKRGWLWKRAVGRSVLIGRRNWKQRFIESDTDAIRYYASEPFNEPLSCIYWSDVVSVIDKAPADEKLETAYDGNFAAAVRERSAGSPTTSFLRSSDKKKAAEVAAREISNNYNTMAANSYSNLIKSTETDDPLDDPLLGTPRQGPSAPQPQIANYFSKAAEDLSFVTTNQSREIYYFGVRFKDEGRHDTKTLLFRTDDQEDFQSWVRYLRRVAELYSLTDDEDDDLETRSGTGVVERFSRKLRSVVSLQKQRYTKDGFDLDLSYVLPNVIAMGFPCEGREELFRNPMSHVVKFFDLYHKKQFHVINLCSERFYPASRFGGKFERFPFDDHNPCPLHLLYDMCESMYDHLTAPPSTDPVTGLLVEGGNPCATPKCVIESVYSLQNTDSPVVAIHCKAGKGRTGLVICAYLMYAGIANLPTDAMSLFAARRTKDGKGIQIPSQRRYLAYLFQSIHSFGGQIPTNAVKIKSVSLNASPIDKGDNSDDSEVFYIRIEQRDHHHRHIPLGKAEGNVKDPLVVIHDSSLDGNYAVRRLLEGGAAATTGSGIGSWSPFRRKTQNEELNIAINATLKGVSDFRVALYSPSKQPDEPIYWCSVWLHTGFLPSGSTTIQFPKMQIDDAAKDKKHQRFPSAFQLTIEFAVLGPGRTRDAPKKPIPCLDALM